MPISRVQDQVTSVNTSTGPPWPIAWQNPTTAGNFLVAALVSDADFGIITPPPVTGPAWSLYSTQVGPTVIKIYTIANADSQSGSYVWNWTSGHGVAFFYAEYQHISLNLPNDGTPKESTGNSNIMASNTMNVLHSTDLAIAVYGQMHVGSSPFPHASNPSNGFNLAMQTAMFLDDDPRHPNRPIMLSAFTDNILSRAGNWSTNLTSNVSDIYTVSQGSWTDTSTGVGGSANLQAIVHISVAGLVNRETSANLTAITTCSPTANITQQSHAPLTSRTALFASGLVKYQASANLLNRTVLTARAGFLRLGSTALHCLAHLTANGQSKRLAQISLHSSVTTSGHAFISFIARGGVYCAGTGHEAVRHDYAYVGSGIIVISGMARSEQRYHFSGLGGVALAGNALCLGVRFGFVATGQVTISGSADVGRNAYLYIAHVVGLHVEFSGIAQVSLFFNDLNCVMPLLTCTAQFPNKYKNCYVPQFYRPERRKEAGAVLRKAGALVAAITVCVQGPYLPKQNKEEQLHAQQL